MLSAVGCACGGHAAAFRACDIASGACAKGRCARQVRAPRPRADASCDNEFIILFIAIVRGRSACVHSYVHACPHERINANVRAHRDATHAKAFLTQLAMMRQTLRRQRLLRIYDLCARGCSRRGGPRAPHAFDIRECHSCHGLAALWRAVQCSGSVQDSA